MMNIALCLREWRLPVLTLACYLPDLLFGHANKKAAAVVACKNKNMDMIYALLYWHRNHNFRVKVMGYAGYFGWREIFPFFRGTAYELDYVNGIIAGNKIITLSYFVHFGLLTDIAYYQKMACDQDKHSILKYLSNYVPFIPTKERFRDVCLSKSVDIDFLMEFVNVHCVTNLTRWAAFYGNSAFTYHLVATYEVDPHLAIINACQSGKTKVIDALCDYRINWHRILEEIAKGIYVPAKTMKYLEKTVTPKYFRLFLLACDNGNYAFVNYMKLKNLITSEWKDIAKFLFDLSEPIKELLE